MSYKIAVVGATGNVGREIINILDERKFPVRELVALASRNSVGKRVSFGDGQVTVAALDGYDFSGVDIVLSSPGSEISKIFAPRAAEEGAIIIDNTSYFRMFEDVPLIVPEVNRHAIADYKKKNIIANPNCSTIQMVVALKPLHDAFGIKRIVVSTYQSTSGKGKAAMDELYRQTKKIYENDNLEPKEFQKRIAFNCIPQIDVFMDSGDTKEEWKMQVETKKILEAEIEVSATCVRVPVFVGHAESVNVEFDKPFTLNEVYEILGDAEGVMVQDRREDGGYATQIECPQTDSVFVSRLRVDKTIANGLNMWIVADNLRKGAALNAVQIAEELINNYI